MKRLLWIVAQFILLGCTLFAQDVTGDWQGTLHTGFGLRIILHIEKQDTGALTALLYSIDQTPDMVAANAVVFKDSTLKADFDLLQAKYEGTISADKQTITGSWTQLFKLPLELHRATKEAAWKRDPSPHTTQFIAVDTNVRLEVLDWGGTGRPLVFLAGLGNTAHVFDTFATKFTSKYHVYGITRRGFGASSAPDSGYSADRLGDDVLAVVDALKLDRPVLAGHSIAGEELSSIGSRHPEKIAGLIYLDAGYAHAFYDRSRGDLNLDALELKKKLDLVGFGSGQDGAPIIQELLATDLPQLEKELKEALKDVELEPANLRTLKLPGPSRAILAGEQKYTDIKVPVLAIYAVPVSNGPLPGDPAQRAAAEARDTEKAEAQIKAFEAGVPKARIIRLPHADHYVFVSNEGDVWREMNTFLSSLP
ncbi:MAG TPA: alpha/beta hydrolase [Candidatus Angelobacter sp.]|nr:alpha/beta hydrolase [Candidatus Angelobacter sp.]